MQGDKETRTRPLRSWSFGSIPVEIPQPKAPLLLSEPVKTPAPNTDTEKPAKSFFKKSLSKSKRHRRASTSSAGDGEGLLESPEPSPREAGSLDETVRLLKVETRTCVAKMRSEIAHASAQIDDLDRRVVAAHQKTQLAMEDASFEQKRMWQRLFAAQEAMQRRLAMPPMPADTPNAGALESDAAEHACLPCACFSCGSSAEPFSDSVL